MPSLKHLASRFAIACALLALSACDPQRISELEEGLSTEVDVRDRFGVPDQVWDDGGGSRTLDSPARSIPGMGMDEVRRRSGKPAKVTPLALQNETHHDWRFLEPPNTTMVFTVVADRQLRVLRTQVGPDLNMQQGGGR